jgi:hypothetical protein
VLLKSWVRGVIFDVMYLLLLLVAHTIIFVLSYTTFSVCLHQSLYRHELLCCYHGLFVLFDKWEHVDLSPSAIFVAIVSWSFSINQFPLHLAGIMSLDVVHDTTSVPYRSTLLTDLSIGQLSLAIIFPLFWQSNLDDNNDKYINMQWRVVKVFVRWGNKIVWCIGVVYFIYFHQYTRSGPVFWAPCEKLFVPKHLNVIRPAFI